MGINSNFLPPRTVGDKHIQDHEVIRPYGDGAREVPKIARWMHGSWCQNYLVHTKLLIFQLDGKAAVCNGRNTLKKNKVTNMINSPMSKRSLGHNLPTLVLLGLSKSISSTY